MSEGQDAGDSVKTLVLPQLTEDQGVLFRSWVRLKYKHSKLATQEQLKLGMRSPFVLAKIGNDLRQSYDDMIEEPLPEGIRRAVAQLPTKPKLQVVSAPPTKGADKLSQ